MIEAAEVEEGLQPRPLDARELLQLPLALGHLLGRGLERRALGQLATLPRRRPLQVDAVRHLPVGVLGVQVDGRLEPVSEPVDVGGVGVDVLPERVGVLHQQAQRLGVVGRLERAGRREGRRQVLAARAARRVLGARPDDHRLQDGLKAPLGLARPHGLRHDVAST
jgi:hypothetical protein